jgi:hypothetical protein
MAGKLQPEYSGNPGNNKYKGIMDSIISSLYPCKINYLPHFPPQINQKENNQ